MQKLAALAVVVAAAVFWFGVSAWIAGGPGPLLSLFVPNVSCNAVSEDCRTRMRADARFRMRLGDAENGQALYRILALAGDDRSATRFRGLRSDSNIIGAIHDQLAPIPTATLAEETKLREALDSVASAQRLIKGPAGDEWPLYDDETPESRDRVPIFEEERARHAEKDRQRGDCSGISVDPRAVRAGDLAFQQLVNKPQADGLRAAIQ